LVYVGAQADGYVVGEELEGDDFEDGKEEFRGGGDFDGVFDGAGDLVVAWVAMAMTWPERAGTSEVCAGRRARRPGAKEGVEKGEKHVSEAKASLIPWSVMPALKCRPIKYPRFSAASKAP
jgi:hypothetical protein